MTVSSVIKLSDIESYSSIKKNLEGKKCSLQFLPVSLETISKQKNFIYKGQNWWQGNRESILRSDNKEVNQFVFASEFMKEIQKNLGLKK
mgnify:CR=1 FL=1